jgi:hypothetical protein
VGGDDRYAQLAAAYVESAAKPGQTLVISPTHAEAERITGEIRAALKASGALPQADRQFIALRPVNLTDAERADALSYQRDDVLVFHQNAKGIQRGAHITVGLDPSTLPLRHAKHFTVYRPHALLLAAGDRVRITKNVAPKDGSVRLNNGDLHTIASIAKDGSITLDNHAVLPASFGFLDYGYCTTSHASQGKSVERVIIGQSSHSFPASSMEQFYVSVSRGKKSAVIFTDNREALLEAVSHADQRLTATDLAFDRDRDHEHEHGHTHERDATSAVRAKRLPPSITSPSVPEYTPLPHDHERRGEVSRER